MISTTKATTFLDTSTCKCTDPASVYMTISLTVQKTQVHKNFDKSAQTLTCRNPYKFIMYSSCVSSRKSLLPKNVGLQKTY